MNPAFINDHQQKIVQLVASLPLPQPMKDRLLDPERLEKQKFLFLPFALAFADCFPGLTAADHILINASTYLGASGVYTMDGVFDLQIEGPAIQEPLIYGQLYMQESQRLLSRLFPDEGSFWVQYYQRYSDHFQELEESRQVDKELDFAHYRQLLGYKYSLLYVPVDMLFYLSGEKHRAAYDKIQESLQWFTVGYNLPNEVKGLEEDIRTGVNNYAWWRLRDELEQHDINPADHSAEEVHKLLYATGLAEQLLVESLDAFEKALAIVADLEVPLFRAIIEARMQSNRDMKAQIQEHLAAIA